MNAPNSKYKVVNVQFQTCNGGCEDPAWDETQFDIENSGNFVEMMNELLCLFKEFAVENQIDWSAHIISVSEGGEYGNA